MTDETSFQALGPTGVQLFQESLLNNDAETDNSETDRHLHSPGIRQKCGYFDDALHNRPLPNLNIYRKLMQTSLRNDPPSRGTASSTIRLGVDGNHSAGPFRASNRHDDILTSLAEFDDENAVDAFVGSPSYIRSSARGGSRPRWSSADTSSPRHPPPTAAAADGFLDRYLNRIRVEDVAPESDILQEPVSETNEPAECDNTLTPSDWRHSCKGVRDRLCNVLGTQRFADVYFYVGGGRSETAKPGGGSAGESQRVSRSNSVLSPRPLRCPMSRRSTASAQRRLNTEQQRRITSAIAQASGNTSAVAQASPAGSDTEDAELATKRHEATAAEKAKTLAEMLLALRDTNFTSEVQSLSSSPSTSPSEISQYIDGTTSTAVMCHLSDTSDIDVVPGGEEEIKSSNLPAQQPTNTQSESSVAKSEVKKFAVHKLMLAIASPVFEAMFFGAFAEGAKPVNNAASGVMEVFVEDVTAAAFQQCLRYIYYDDMSLVDSLDDLYDTLYAAKKYLLSPLVTACSNRLVSLMTPQNVLLQLNRCSAMDEDELFKICWHTIDVLTPEVLTSEHFIDLERHTLLKLISRETLYCEEWEIFEALMRWSRMECTRTGISATPSNVANIMREFLHYIRFTAMSLEDFIIHVSKTDVLSLEAQHTLLLQIATKIFAESDEKQAGKSLEGTSYGQKEDVGIGSLKRKGPHVHKCRRFLQSVATSSKEAIWSDTEYVIFQVSKPVYLAGVGLFGPLIKDTQLKVKAELRQCTLSQSSRLSSRSVSNGTGGFGVTYRSTGVSTLISGSSHRHSQRHSGNQTHSYLRSSNDPSRRRSHGGSTRMRSGTQILASPPTPTTTPRTLFKSVKTKGGALASLEITLNCTSSTNGIIEARFSRPVKLKNGQHYVISVSPEEGRNTRCYMGAVPARSSISVRTRIPSTSAETAVEGSTPCSDSRPTVTFDFAFGANSGGESGINGFGDVSAVSIGEKHATGVGEAPHVPQLLFFPVS
ncbi:hypothetical protein Aperf_G00000049791 [Anoplocephala perfoliata]